MFFGASHVLAQRLNEEALLDLDVNNFSGECEYQGRYDYYENCGGAGTVFIVLAAVPETRAYVILVQVQIVSEADLEALDRILDTFNVVGELPSE